MISALIIIFIIGPSSLFSQVNLLNPRFEFTPGIRYDQLITSPKDYLGYELGTEYTIYADVLNYFRNLGEQSERVSIHPYGKTHEGRVLEYLIITGDKNRKRLKEIQKNNLRLADPRNINANIDWGYAADYVDAFYKIINHNESLNFIVANGSTNSNPLTIANTNSAINKSLSCLKLFIIVLNILLFINISPKQTIRQTFV